MKRCDIPEASHTPGPDSCATSGAGGDTLKTVLNSYADARGAALVSWPESRKRVELVFRQVLDLPLDSLTAAEIQMTADRYHSPKAADFALRSIRPALKWAAQRGYTHLDSSQLRQRTTPDRQTRVLSRQELRSILPILKNSTRPHATAMWMMLLTLARREQVGAAEWAHVDLNAAIWKIPGTTCSGARILPLSRQVNDLLLGVGERVGPVRLEGLIFRSRSGGRLDHWDHETKAIHKASGTSDWTRRDLRRTGAAMLDDMGVGRDTISNVLMRLPAAANETQACAWLETAKALQMLADALDGIVPQGVV